MKLSVYYSMGLCGTICILAYLLYGREGASAQSDRINSLSAYSLSLSAPFCGQRLRFLPELRTHYSFFFSVSSCISPTGSYCTVP